jgi:hypothetical protein
MRYLILILGLFISANSYADLTYQEWKYLYEDGIDEGRDLAEFYIAGIGQGISWTGTYVETVDESYRLFCLPNSLSLNADNYISILEDAYMDAVNGKVLAESDMQVPLLLLFGFIDTFPCN